MTQMTQLNIKLDVKTRQRVRKCALVAAAKEGKVQGALTSFVLKALEKECSSVERNQKPLVKKET